MKKMAKDMNKYTCCLCGKECDDWGNNPYPLCAEDDYDSRCCDECNAAKVIPARIEAFGAGTKRLKEIREKYAGKSW